MYAQVIISFSEWSRYSKPVNVLSLEAHSVVVVHEAHVALLLFSGSHWPTEGASSAG